MFDREEGTSGVAVVDATVPVVPGMPGVPGNPVAGTPVEDRELLLLRREGCFFIARDWEREEENKRVVKKFCEV